VLRVGAKHKLRLDSQHELHKFFCTKESRSNFIDKYYILDGFSRLKRWDVAFMLDLLT
jgi:hypothetical protein